MRTKTYLGDGVYAVLTEYHDLELTTSDGVSITNRIVLDDYVIKALKEYLNERIEVLPNVSGRSISENV